MDYLLHILILVALYGILAVSLNLIAGYTGLLSVAHAAFYGVGAYVTALMALHWHTPFLLNVVAGMVVAGVVGVLVAAPSLRVHDDYFVLTTFAFQVIAFSILNNWVDFTGGPMGLPGIPQPTLFGLTISSHWGFLLLTSAFLTVGFWFSHRLAESPYGRVLKAIREDEVFAQSLGKDVTRYKVEVFVLGAMLAATAGSLYAVYITFIDPTSFTVPESIFILAIVIVGGAGNLWGSLVGAALLVTLPEALRFLGMPSAVAANMRQILYGALLVLFMLFRPQGIVAERVGLREPRRARRPRRETRSAGS